MSDINPIAAEVVGHILEAKPSESSTNPADEMKMLERERQSILNQGIKDDIEARKIFAFRIFVMLALWLLAILLLIVMTGIAWLKISDTVILGLIGSTTVTVASFFIAVTQYLFPSQKKGPQSDIP